MIGLHPGLPHPLGATWHGDGVNFAVMSRAAQAIDLCFFEEGKQGDKEVSRFRLTEHTGEVWHVLLTGLKPGQRYGYRAYGPWNPLQGQFFNPNKVLLDPYATASTADVAWRADIQGPVPHKLDIADPLDNGPMALKAIVPEQKPFNWRKVPPPKIPWEETVIYEMHVKGLTKLFPLIPEDYRGTYAGLARPEVIAYFKELGVTTLQLLPVQMHLDDGFLQPKNLTNYWGYNSIGFFAPHPEYARDQTPLGVVREFREMVRSLHAAGLEVILDVVYNHTGEAGPDGPLINFRGLDNLTYYRHSAKNPGQYIDYTGCGNSLNLHNPYVLRMVIDSLRYWVTEMKVDGFRFDLAVTLGRTTERFRADSPFFKAIMQDPVLQKVKMIAEPWDLGPGGYQLGHFPYGWSELNGKFRDCVRSFWKGDFGQASEWASRFAGSQDLFHHNRRSPLASINFLTSHDGFTLNDLVSYNQKHNEANLENNRDGDNTNHAWNCGVEGLTTDRAILELRERQKRNMVTTLFLSTGVPFLCAGDEMGRTQLGNNNGYCQDNPLSWLDWQLAQPGHPGHDLLGYVKKLLAFRKQHRIFRRSRFFRGSAGLEGRHDIEWYSPAGCIMKSEDWNNHHTRAFMVLLEGSQLGGIHNWHASTHDETFLLLLNGSPEEQRYRLPGANAVMWEQVIDTTVPQGFVEHPFTQRAGKSVDMVEHSLIMFRLQTGSRREAQQALK